MTVARTILVLLSALVFARSAHAQAELSRVRQGIVRILVLKLDPSAPGGGRMLSSGSGFVVNEQGTIVTNHHVIDNTLDGSGAFAVIYHDQDLQEVLSQMVAQGATSGEAAAKLLGPKTIRAEVEWSDRKKDLAILKPERSGPGRSLPLAPSRFVEQGDKVRALGYPGINDLMGARAELVLSQQPGEITSNYFHDLMGVPVYHISSNMYHGMSGGPLVNECGEVIGIDGPGMIVSQKPNDIDRAIYSIHVDALMAVLDERKLSYTSVSARCAATSSRTSTSDSSGPIRDASGRDPLLTVGVLGALLLGGGALVLALTSRGRSAVKAVADGVTQRLGRRQQKGGPGAGDRKGANDRVPPQRDRQDGAVPSAHDSPTLYGVSGEYAGVELELSDEPVVIGRDPRVSQLVFSADTAGVSGRHCSIWFDPAHQQVLVKDLWSSHGTFLESGERLVSGEARSLRSADQFYLADPDVLFEVRY
jgi:S1-C subfamily serine protease